MSLPTNSSSKIPKSPTIKRSGKSLQITSTGKNTNIQTVHFFSCGTSAPKEANQRVKLECIQNILENVLKIANDHNAPEEEAKEAFHTALAAIQQAQNKMGKPVKKECTSDLVANLTYAFLEHFGPKMEDICFHTESILRFLYIKKYTESAKNLENSVNRRLDFVTPFEVKRLSPIQVFQSPRKNFTASFLIWTYLKLLMEIENKHNKKCEIIIEDAGLNEERNFLYKPTDSSKHLAPEKKHVFKITLNYKKQEPHSFTIVLSMNNPQDKKIDFSCPNPTSLLQTLNISSKQNFGVLDRFNHPYHHNICYLIKLISCYLKTTFQEPFNHLIKFTNLDYALICLETMVTIDKNILEEPPNPIAKSFNEFLLPLVSPSSKIDKNNLYFFDNFLKHAIVEHAALALNFEEKIKNHCQEWLHLSDTRITDQNDFVYHCLVIESKNHESIKFVLNIIDELDNHLINFTTPKTEKKYLIEAIQSIEFLKKNIESIKNKCMEKDFLSIDISHSIKTLLTKTSKNIL